jgi:hypothetical protein
MNMKSNVDEIQAPKWLTEQLRNKVRKVFEPKYNRTLSDAEVILIALNHVRLMEHFFQYKWRLQHESK